MNYTDLLTKHYLSALEKQLALADWLQARGNPDWGFGMDAGRLTFQPVASFAAQILGTQADHSNTWLWSWANTASNIPPALVKAAEALRAYGEQHNIPEFTQPELNVTETVNGHCIAMIASMMPQSNAYYRGPYDGGAIFLLIEDSAYPVRVARDPVKIINHIPLAVRQGLPLDMGRAIHAYLRQCGTQADLRADGITATFAEGSTVNVALDAQGRVAKIQGDLKNTPR
jgi:hypothetical protein